MWTRGLSAAPPRLSLVRLDAGRGDAAQPDGFITRTCVHLIDVCNRAATPRAVPPRPRMLLMPVRKPKPVARATDPDVIALPRREFLPRPA